MASPFMNMLALLNGDLSGLAETPFGRMASAVGMEFGKPSGPAQASPVPEPSPKPPASTPSTNSSEAQSSVVRPKSYETPGDIGDPVDASLKAHQKAFLNAVAHGESKGRYDVRYTPQGGARFADFKDHPRVLEPRADGRKSSAAGRYQFTAETWDEVNPERGDFSPGRQDAKAWELAKTRYKKVTGGDLDAELQATGLTPKIVQSLSPTWEAFTKNYKQHEMIYNTSLRKYMTPQEKTVVEEAQPMSAPRTLGEPMDAREQAVADERDLQKILTYNEPMEQLGQPASFGARHGNWDSEFDPSYYTEQGRGASLSFPAGYRRTSDNPYGSAIGNVRINEEMWEKAKARMRPSKNVTTQGTSADLRSRATGTFQPDTTPGDGTLAYLRNEFTRAMDEYMKKLPKRAASFEDPEDQEPDVPVKRKAKNAR